MIVDYRSAGMPVVSFLLFGAITGVALFQPAALSQPASNAKPALRIRVSDPHNLPVMKARATLRPAIGGPALEGNGGDTGIIEFLPTAKGRYRIAIEADGFADISRFIDWQEKPVTVDLVMPVGGLREQITITSGSRVEELQEDSPVTSPPSLVKRWSPRVMSVFPTYSRRCLVC